MSVVGIPFEGLMEVVLVMYPYLRIWSCLYFSESFLKTLATAYPLKLDHFFASKINFA